MTIKYSGYEILKEKIKLNKIAVINLRNDHQKFKLKTNIKNIDL
jgi:hypothetical protein